MTSVFSLKRGSGLLEGVGQRSQMADRDRDLVAGTKEFRRVETEPNAGRRAGCDDVARLQRQPGGNGCDQGRNIEDQVTRIGILAKLAVHPAFDVEIFGVE